MLITGIAKPRIGPILSRHISHYSPSVTLSLYCHRTTALAPVRHSAELHATDVTHRTSGSITYRSNTLC